MVIRGLVGLLVLWSIWLAGTGPSVSAQTAAGPVTIQIDKTQLNNGGTLKVSGTAPAGKPVYLEIYAEKTVRANFFDKKRDKDTGQSPGGQAHRRCGVDHSGPDLVGGAFLSPVFRSWNGPPSF